MQPASLSMEASILGIRNGPFLKALFKSVKSIHILILPFFFGTNTTFASQSEYLTSLMTFASSSLCTSVFAAKIMSSDIFLCLCFFCFMFGLMSRECYMMSLLTPCKSEANHAKMPLFLAKTSRSSSSSLLEMLPQMVTFLSRIASLSGTVFVSSCSLRYVFPLGMSGGSGALLLAV